LNTVIPFKDERYRRARPSLAQPATSVLRVTDEIGLHPSLRGFSTLLEANRLAILQGVGYPNPNRSHFESMDIWHTARTDLADRSTGWLGRATDADKAGGAASSDPPAMHVGAEVQPLALMGRDVVAPSLRSLEQFRLSRQIAKGERAAIQQFSDAPRSGASDLLQYVTARTTDALQLSQRMESADSPYRTMVKYPSLPLAEKLKQIAQLIDAGLKTRVYYVALDGFDTHSEQADAHSGLLSQLGGSLAAFTEDLEQHGHLDRVTTLVFSEFGRRVQENSSRGTDHGAAAPVFLIGNQVQPGLVGRHPDLDDLDDGDLKFHTDFRGIYAALLANWLGWKAGDALDSKVDALELFQA
jgi:uncharacterized protein (DUF1501 family)